MKCALMEAGRLRGVLVIGMSSAREYERHWEGLAREFRHKGGIADLGATVRAIYSSC